MFPTPRIVVSYHVPTGVGSCVVGGKVSPQNRTAIIQGSRFVYLYRPQNLKRYVTFADENGAIAVIYLKVKTNLYAVHKLATIIVI